MSVTPFSLSVPSPPVGSDYRDGIEWSPLSQTNMINIDEDTIAEHTDKRKNERHKYLQMKERERYMYRQQQIKPTTIPRQHEWHLNRDQKEDSTVERPQQHDTFITATSDTDNLITTNTPALEEDYNAELKPVSETVGTLHRPSSSSSSTIIPTNVSDRNDDNVINHVEYKILPQSSATTITEDLSNRNRVNAYNAFIHNRVEQMLLTHHIFTKENGQIRVVKRTLDKKKKQKSSSQRCNNTKSDENIDYDHRNVSHHPISNNFNIPTSSITSIRLASPDERRLYFLLIFLSRIPLFADLVLSDFIALADKLQIQTFDQYEVIANEGEQGDYIYLIKQGTLQVKLLLDQQDHHMEDDRMIKDQIEIPYITDTDIQQISNILPPIRRRFHSVNTAALTVASLSAHDIVGESILLSSSHSHHASVIAMSPHVTCYAIHYMHLLRYLNESTICALKDYIHYISLLRSRHAIVRQRYRSSYHTAPVDFRLFVHGNINRNLTQKNERKKIMAEATRRSNYHNYSNNNNSRTHRSSAAMRQIQHTQKYSLKATDERKKKASGNNDEQTDIRSDISENEDEMSDPHVHAIRTVQTNDAAVYLSLLNNSKPSTPSETEDVYDTGCVTENRETDG